MWTNVGERGKQEGGHEGWVYVVEGWRLSATSQAMGSTIAFVAVSMYSE